jgi:hypothetical protein
MPNTNIKSLNYSDTQNEIIQKLNNNFDDLIEIHGGVQGNPGPTGGGGPIGILGEKGNTGISGPRGTRWFVKSSQPGGTGTYAVEGDYWVEISTTKIYIFTDSGWVDTGYFLSPQDVLFRDVLYNSLGGSSGVAITENKSSPSLYTFVLGDESPENSPLINQNLSKFVISTDNSVNDSPLLEFSKSDLENGTISDYTAHPYFSWSNFSPSNLDLLLETPGGKFYMGGSGGIDVRASNISVESYTGITFDGVFNIWATGGINLSFPSGNTNISSNNMEIGPTFSSIERGLSISPQLSSPSPSIYIESGSTGALKTERTADTYDNISHSIYNVMLESNGATASESQFIIDTKGKIKTNKVDGGVTYPSSNFGATSSAGSTTIFWYLVARTSSPSNANTGVYRPFALNSGNIAAVNPYSTAYASSFCGIGVYSFTNYSWGSTGGIGRGESIRFSAYCSQNPGGSTAYSGFRYIGYGGNSASMVTAATLPFYATCVDFVISRGATGPGTSVSYLAYGSSGGSGGSFYFDI